MLEVPKKVVGGSVRPLEVLVSCLMEASKLLSVLKAIETVRDSQVCDQSLPLLGAVVVPGQHHSHLAVKDLLSYRCRKEGFPNTSKGWLDGD